MKPITELLARGERTLRALLVSTLEGIAALITLVGIRLYARSLLSRAAIRLLLGLASAIHRRCIRLLRSAKP
ncbi:MULTISPECIES: hypothetical protein [Pseudomonas]|uniref:Uncharacterized protein n=3 Tax=Pseudomonas chlororaphis TaxID=587753 RepID=A0AAP9W5M2_9PSED|nr:MULTISPECIES: hypothetical protein [Pseudomonas]AIC19756.1 hypothetical protein EY04_12845 [Pseudomonas chlororaphis]AUG40795.1 hypothetical protein CXP47_13180 [Pseudomonas chlororaphis]AZC30736.1 hypothetical protein C4K38_2776 [Pseudomonas chlororaphis subsp. piscium]AZD92207.1 hypothetical protein C4K13_2790 [Pseudomonas chlororaphis subsp. aureofaciens]AZD98662.1 hypothetical protein C4K12_2796 [Pseudomonas chlororaphis subsp. aureofaciens]